MPDWFYRPVSRPLLFRLPAERARDLALGVMGTLCRLPGGPLLIDFLGHMRADPRLACTRLGIRFPSPVGIGPGLDTRATALPALARFGIGFLEVGPVTLAGSAGSSPLRRQADRQAVWRPDPGASLSVADAAARLREVRPSGVPLLVHVSAAATATTEQACTEYEHVAARLAEVANVLVLDSLAVAVADHWEPGAWLTHLRGIQRALERTPRPVLLSVPADLDDASLGRYLGPALAAGVSGVLVEGSMRAEGGGRVYGLPVHAVALDQVRRIRGTWPDVMLVGSGGVHEPEQALDMLASGADLISTDTGLIYTGPGLPKRINEAVLHAEEREERAPELAATERVWFWTTLLGAGMLLGSLLAMLIAATRIVLPYDEAFVNVSRDELQAVNPRLLSFLAHDRVSLAGTMIAIGVLYLGLSLFGVRRGMHWAQQSVFASAFVGFATFFLFLGYGYLDPFHAFVTAILFQFLLLALHSKLGPAPVPDRPQLQGDWRWRLGLWGQLLHVGHAVAVITAGVVISTFGVTRVFVPEDLEFMQTTAEALRQANPRLLPLIAHDRATFGGNLVSVGFVLLLPALWGYRPCSGWLWWTLMLAVVPAYAAAIAVHLVVGYTDFFHLLPAFAGLGVFLLGEALLYPYLCAPGAADEEWRKYRGR